MSDVSIRSSDNVSDVKSFGLVPENCQICLQTGHGYHFGAFTCRACAAFFRRCYFSQATDQRKCRNIIGGCKPTKNGRWFCKKCRLDKCLGLGMEPSNIQYDRDAFKSSTTFLKSQKIASSVGDRVGVPMTIETSLYIHPLVFFSKSTEQMDSLPFVDVTQLVEKALKHLLIPNLIQNPKKVSNLEQLAFGLEEIQKHQKEDLSETKELSRNDQIREWERSMCAAAEWINSCDFYRNHNESSKVHLFQNIWYIWGRLERIAMTARMRIKRKCGKKQFVISDDELVDLETMSCDISWWSNSRFEDLQYFFTPCEIYYNEIVDLMTEIQPSNVELAFLMCGLCFHFYEQFHGEEIEKDLEGFQQILFNDLHEYYTNIKQPVYLPRLKQLMKIHEKFKKLRFLRNEKYHIAWTFDILRMRISNEQFFYIAP